MPNSPRDASAPNAQETLTGWWVYLNTRMLICVFLGFTSGLPLFTLIYLVQAWLRSEGVSLQNIGLLTLTQTPYIWKFLWAPLMDRYVPHLPGWRPGRRRGWMLLTQILVAGAIALMGFVSPRQSIWLVSRLAFLIAFFGASLDISIDAYRRELLNDAQLGLGNAVHVNAYKIAALVPGSLALILSDHLPWSTVFVVTAAFMLPGAVMTLVVKEPEIHGAPPKNLFKAIVEPFREFITRNGWCSALFVLVFIFLYKLGDSMATTLSTSFFLDVGFSRTEIGIIAKMTAFGASLAGGIIGGIALVKIGINRGLWIFGLLQMVSTLGFAWLAQLDAQSPSLAILYDCAVSTSHAVTHFAAVFGLHISPQFDAREFALALVYGLETFATGLTLAAFTAYIASATDPRYTATQFALFTSLSAVPRTLAASASGFIVAEIHWFNYFLLCTALAIPGMLVLSWVAPWRQRGNTTGIAAIDSVFRQYANFDGRARRAEYWHFQLLRVIYGVIVAIVAGAAMAAPSRHGFSIIGLLLLSILLLILILAGFALIVPGIAVAVRRLHDTNRSGWFLLAGFVPVVGTLFLLVWLCARGTDGPNRFGAESIAKA